VAECALYHVIVKTLIVRNPSAYRLYLIVTMDTTTLTTAIFFAHYHRSCVRSRGFSYHIDHRPVTALGSRNCMVHSSRNGIRYFGFVSVLDVCKYLRKYNVLQKKTKSQKKRIVIYCICHWKPSGIICEVMV